MKKTKVFALLATLFVGIFSNLFTPVVSAADDEKVSITLHKVKDYKNDETDNEIKNTGDEILTEDFNFLPGITFNAYDVTTEYYAAYDASVATKSVSEAISDAVKAVKGEKAGDAPSGKDPVATKETDTYGRATFSLNAKSSGTTTDDTRDAVYLFVEQASDGVATIADNLVVSLPIYKQGTNDEVLPEIHLYPKNITKETPFDKEITSQKNGVKQTDFSIGQIIDYKLKTTIPADIAAEKLVKVEVEGQVQDQARKLYNFFRFVDTFQSDQLSFINDPKNFSVAVVGGDALTYDVDYKVEVDTATVPGTTTVTTALTAVGIDKLANLANKEISFDYQMKINSLKYIDTEIKNTAQAIFGNDGTTGIGEWNDKTDPDSETVKTGGYKFVKVDVNNHDKTLAGAKFVVRAADAPAADAPAAPAEKYLKIDDTTKEISWVGTSGEATEFETLADGFVDIKGLEYGTYFLEETKAPDGYALPTGNAAYTKFVVGEIPYITISATPLKIFNTPKGLLPSTGGAGIILFVALGAAMVGLAGVYFTSRRKDS
ncbi:SpaH/EbpB family LPXTG-anchored major pilin [Streptococcus suis]|uniref:SpaH/EbpB family LPXTG-anchored major pilin n=1 Tax=Streptococcus parasuis TaxID=1501662 RepID=UPI0023786509|nr:SpaH/EbpB family LPXTG-anchored major pilin [Streptococcus parasuis]MDG3180376.1 SpaH/EbpB family LPXTG-anchored major pilin [Streptococcus suis]WDM37197.1 SpaH/EbpB family LPXTG-anchored major pilin [Streptococcus parasuis]